MQLYLLDAALLGGLFAVVLPALIHLISRRQARRVRFAPLELLLRSQKRTARNVRLQQFLLLLVRTLLIAAIAFAVTRPTLRDTPPPSTTQAPIAVVLAIDVSASMQTVLDGTSAFARSRKKALQAARELPEDVRVGVVACDAPPRDLAVPAFERRVAVAALEGLEVGAGTSDLEACLARAIGLSRTVPGEGERRVMVFSDLAAHAFPTGRSAAGEGRGLRIDWVAAFDEEAPPNRAIVDVETQRDGDTLQVDFRAGAWGGPPLDVAADLLIGARRSARLTLPMASGRTLDRRFTASLDASVAGRDAAQSAGAAATVENQLENQLDKQLDKQLDEQAVEQAVEQARAIVRLDDDALALDNEAVLPLEAPRALRVLVVDGEPDAVPFSDEAFYLSAALQKARARRARIDVDVATLDRVTPASVAAARVIVLANVPRLDDALAQAIVGQVQAGAGLFVAVGDQVDVDAYNAALGAVLPAVLRGVKGQALLDDASVSDALGLVRFRTGHPLFGGLASVDGDTLPGLSRVRTNTYMLVEPDANADRQVLASFTNGAPALLERTVGGQGRVLLLTTTIDREWSDLAIRPGFLPLMQQVVLLLGSALDDAGPRVLRVGAVRALRVPAGSVGLDVLDPGGHMTRLEGTGTVTFADTVRPGLYDVRARNADDEQRALPAERFTVLIDPRESDLTRASPTTLKDAAPGGAITRGVDDDDAGSALWPWLLAAASALLLVEAILVRRRARADA